MKFFSFFLIFFFAFTIRAQTFQRDFTLAENSAIQVTNLYGRVSLVAEEDAVKSDESEKKDETGKVFLSAENTKESDFKIAAENKRLEIIAAPSDQKTRIDLTLKIPAHLKVKVETKDGEVRLEGNFESAEIKTETGTIAANVPLDDLKYDFVWTESRPRFLSDVKLEEADEKAAGKFVVSGKIGEKNGKEKTKNKILKIPDDAKNPDKNPDNDAATTGAESVGKSDDKKERKKNKNLEKQSQRSKTVKLNFTTARGIVLLNVNPNEVPSDLRERPLTEAAKAIVRSGDALLTEAIRRASPKYFGDYAATLPPRKSFPVFSENKNSQTTINSPVKRVLARVTDINNRAIADLKREDFEVFESNETREILSVEPTTAPFNLVLLLDVSGSVDSYVDFIRKTARSFVNTVNPSDKIAIIIFNEDVKTLSTFTTDKGVLSESLDTFDAGGGTAYYDALAYTLAETLRPLKGERTAIVVLSDGDDNRSFLPFDSLLGSIQESGALIYPLYVPSELIAASANNQANSTVDPLRSRYMGLTTKAEGEGEKLAEVSGGVYYPITQIGDLQRAYQDIAVQLRTAYSITFRSDTAEIRDNRLSPRLRVKVKRENSFVRLGSVVEVAQKEVSDARNEDFPQKLDGANEYSTVKNTKRTETNQFYAATNTLRRKVDFVLFAGQTPEISGEIEKIKYKQFVNDALRESMLENFDINKAKGAFILNNGNEKIAVSRWISPKRTRSYPYERVYDTLAFAGKKVTIIPVVKDEGLGGERDFLQWDTISLLSLLDVRVILAYYNEAEKNLKKGDQITAQKFDNKYITARLNEVFNFKGTAREWNERESKQLKTMFEKAKLAYAEISKNSKTYLHDDTALIEIIKYAETPQKFIEFSRLKARKAQSREFQTLQPKEALSSDTKGKVTITNALFGKYFFTVDETLIEPQTVYLIEAKHSVRSKFPSRNDIKDGLVKMIIYTNLQNVKVGAKRLDCKAQIRLTSSKLAGSITSEMSDNVLVNFCSDNLIDAASREFLTKLFQEARENNFTIILEHAEIAN